MDAFKSKPSLSDQLKSKHSLEKEQVRQVDEVQQYLIKNKIDALFNEMLTGLVMRKPEDIRSDLLSSLKKLKKGQRCFDKKDFQVMFDGYDFVEKGGQQIHYKNIIQALENINIPYSHESFLQKYPQFKLGKYVKKDDFVSLMEKQYAQYTAFA